MPTMTVAYASLRKDQLSDATPQMNVIQRVGGAIGTAVLAVVLQQASEGANSRQRRRHRVRDRLPFGARDRPAGPDPCVVLWRAEMPAGPVTEEETNRGG